VLARIIIGLAVTVICFAVAGRRFFWLSKLIRSGAKADRTWQGSRRTKEVISAEVVEVAGQRKLLKWTVPGIAHFFTMWGFTVLLTTIIEAYGALFNRDFHIPLIGQSNWLAFVEDFFATAVLVSLVVFTIIRIENAPARKDRASRFYGSHLGPAWLVLFMISMVIITLLAYRGAQVNTGHFPFYSGTPSDTSTSYNQAHSSSWAFASQFVASLFGGLGVGVNDVIEVVFLLANVAVIAGFMVFVCLLEAPAHLLGPDQCLLLPSSPGPRWPRQDAGHGHGERHRGHGLWCRQDRGLHVEADARLLDLHRVWSLPVGLPGLEHRQAA
jgi:hypothetical protein